MRGPRPNITSPIHQSSPLLKASRMLRENGENGKEMKGESGVVVVMNNGGAAVVDEWCWWAGAGTAQLGWGIWAFRRGYAGDSRFMPLKAFTVASLFVGALASASVASLRASGVHSVEDMKAMGANIRTGLGVQPRTREK